MHKRKEDKTRIKKGFWENEFVIFLIGPLIFLIIVKFTGYQIFYGGNPADKGRKKVVWLLSLGAGFYFIIILILMLNSM